MPESKTTRKPKPDELEIMFPDVPVKTRIGEFVVSPIPFNSFKRVIDLVKKYQAIIGATPEANLFNLIIANAEEGIQDIQEFIQICCPITAEQIEQLRMDDVVNLFMTAVEANRDFLLLRLQESGLRSALVTGSLTGQTSSAS